MERAGVEHVIFFEPSTSGLADAKAQMIKVENAVRVRIDAHEYPCLLGKLAVRVE